MADGPGVRNELGGVVGGPVVQAGSIQHVSLAGSLPAGSGQAEGPPRQLPLTVRDFTGRAEHLAALNALLPNDNDEQTPGAVVISAVDGTAGIGKTTLAVYWAHQVQHEFPDGTLHANLRGYGPGEPATTGEVLDGFLRALGTPAPQKPVGVEERAGLFRSLLAGRKVLIVLDNANSADQVRPLLPGAPGCVVVVTSRNSLTGLVVTESAHRLTLDLLTEPEALQLVIGIIGQPRAAEEPGAVTDLIRLCARLPLALQIAAGRVAAHSHHTVAEVVTELTDDRDRLDVLSRGEDERAAVRAVFDWSYQRLPAGQARLFRCLGLHPGPEISLHAAAAVADLDPPTTWRLLEGLTGAHLIEPVAGGRYRFHDLLRAYAAEQHHDSADDRDHALEALLGWYAHTGWVCDQQVYPAHYRLPLRIATPAHPMPITDRPQALAWLDIEQANLLAALHHAAQHGLDHHALDLVESIRFLGVRGTWDAMLEAEAAGLAAAQHADDRRAECWFRVKRGENLVATQRWGEALTEFDHALELARDLGDRFLHAAALNGLGWLFREQERFEEALRYLREALPLSRGVDSGRMEAVVESNLSWACIGLGRYQQALDHSERSLVQRQRVGDTSGEAQVLNQLARAWQGLGEHQKAITLCRQAIALGRTHGNLAYTVATPLDTLAVSLHHTGHPADAVQCWREAADIFDDHGHLRSATQVRERLHELDVTESSSEQLRELR